MSMKAPGSHAPHDAPACQGPGLGIPGHANPMHQCPPKRFRFAGQGMGIPNTDAHGPYPDAKLRPGEVGRILMSAQAASKRKAKGA